MTPSHFCLGTHDPLGHLFLGTRDLPLEKMTPPPPPYMHSCRIANAKNQPLQFQMSHRGHCAEAVEHFLSCTHE